MTLFLFAKQLVDMLYQYHTLDYIMVILVFLLLIYQIALVRPNFRKRFMLTDGIVVALGALLTITFFRSGDGYQAYFKVMSAFLIYFVGRVYYDRIKECYGVLTLSAYLVVYSNLLVRFYHFGLAFIKVQDAGGDLYYYDTDMAFAMILAMVFITMFGKNTVFKLITIFVVCPYMVFWSDAGIQMILMLAIYAIMAIYLVELAINNRKLTNILLTIIISGLLGTVAVIYMPVLGFENPELIVNLFQGKFLNNSSMYSRYAEWKMILDSCGTQGILTNLFGSGMGAEISIRSLYIKIFYSLGYVGLFLTFMLIVSIMYYVTKVDDRKTFYLAVIMAVLLLGSGVTVNSMEATQMSWFPMLFSGMVISSVQVDKEKKTDRKE
ncbi:hypothetical protein [Parablautia intestinalis]|uniref:hypothetical protein n=1 Tax=Parablautia intestinalis TaxID=2320100 RepID=UPI00256E9DA1|nr:hypothetical protein [Parablautia intestinalis]